MEMTLAGLVAKIAGNVVGIDCQACIVLQKKQRGIVGTKVFLLQNEIKKTEFDCKISFLCGDDRNGEKHERKEMDFLLEERGCGGVSRMDSKG